MSDAEFLATACGVLAGLCFVFVFLRAYLREHPWWLEANYGKNWQAELETMRAEMDRTIGTLDVERGRAAPGRIIRVRSPEDVTPIHGSAPAAVSCRGCGAPKLEGDACSYCGGVR